jgi:hypothetical protein
VKNSKRIKELEVKVEALTLLMETVFVILHEVVEKNNNKLDLDSGKWYKDRP